MKTTVINGCGEVNALTAAMLDQVRENLPDAGQINLAENPVKACIGCDACQAVHPGLCGLKDNQNDVLMEFMSSRLAVIVTPVRFGCCNALTKNFMDRTQPLFLPFQVGKNGRSIMKPRYETYPDQVWLGIMDGRAADEAAAFEAFVINSNLARASQHVTAMAVTSMDDLNLIAPLFAAGRN
ncbi:hypothetical protein hrd7_05580 [Leptolinea sp. HRD-7]|nr:hypothetical protein hrd7_05580 [Leptolinea sp. HRD-7]